LITDLTQLLQNAASGGLGVGDTVDLTGYALSQTAQNIQIPLLRNYGVNVVF